MANEFSKLEAALVEAGRGIPYGATPALTERVLRELQATAPAREVKRSGWFSPRVLVPIGAAILLALALLLALPAARDAVAQFLGLPGLPVFYVTPTPLPPPTATPAPEDTPRPTRTATPTRAPDTLCCEMTLQAAAARSHLPLLVPKGEWPSQVYYQRMLDIGEQVVMLFGDPAEPRFTLYQADYWVYGKMLANPEGVKGQTHLAETQVRGERALWFSGAAHLLVRLDANGQPDYQIARTVDANTLVWQVGGMDRGTIYRLETKLPFEAAVRFVESLVELSDATVTPTSDSGN